ncbi:MAG: LLM class flavin-dependent oxidoreductase, partial [Trueperaceae bacterium]|nr:LLM class flavin-dependent oxidoreductase [Trueperaceae bacterium]
IGVFTFGDHGPDPVTGLAPSPAERMRQVVDEAVLAEQVGLDVFGVGEHHRGDFILSAPEVVLAAIAARTERIRLTSAVTVLSSDDPVRVFQRFATLDLLSSGRAEVLAGRGSFVESFPLFGYDLGDYERLFTEKLELLLALRASTRVTWRGTTRAPLDGQEVHPRPLQELLPVWVGVGGTPESAWRAGSLGLPMALAIIGGLPERFAPFARIHREALGAAGHRPQALAVTGHAFVADDARRAADVAFPPYAAVMSRIGRERGWGPMTRPQFEAMREPRGSLFVGDPDQVVEKLVAHHALFEHQRALFQMGLGTLPHREVLRSIELLGTEVAPRVRRAVAERAAGAGAAG